MEKPRFLSCHNCWMRLQDPDPTCLKFPLTIWLSSEADSGATVSVPTEQKMRSTFILARECVGGRVEKPLVLLASFLWLCLVLFNKINFFFSQIHVNGLPLHFHLQQDLIPSYSEFSTWKLLIFGGTLFSYTFHEAAVISPFLHPSFALSLMSVLASVLLELLLLWWGLLAN